MVAVAYISVAGEQFNVRHYGARGDGVHDDTAAIQTTINTAHDAAIQTSYRVYFPQGHYRVTSSLSIPGGCTLHGDGPGASWIEGVNVSGYVIEDVAATDPSYTQQPTSILRLRITNTGTPRGGIWRVGQDKINCVVDHVLFSCDGDAITTLQASGGPGGAFSFTISDSKLIAGTSYSFINGTAAIRANIDAFLANRVDIQGWGYSYRVGGQSFVCHGGRHENNDTVFHFGFLPDGTSQGMSNFEIDGCQLEANNNSIVMHSADCGTVENMVGNTWGETQAPIAPVYGIQIETAARVTFKNITISGNFSKSALQVQSGSLLTFENVNVANLTATAAAWDMRTTDQSSFKFVNCNYPTVSKLGTSTDVSQGSVSLRGLAHADALRTVKVPKNLSGSATVTSGTTSVAIAFPVALDPNGLIHGLAALVGGSLAVASYTYGIAILNEMGLSLAYFGSGGETTISTDAGHKQIFMGVTDLGGDHTTYAYRLYRKVTGASSWTGYWDISQTIGTFTDDGTIPFNGYEQDGTAATTPSGAEADASYFIDLGVAWSTTAYVPAADKSTTGFTARFGTAPGSDMLVSWKLYR